MLAPNDIGAIQEHREQSDEDIEMDTKNNT